MLRGPLGDVAQRAARQEGVHVEDAYAAALCWWAAAVAPSATLPTRSKDWPCLVWGAFLTGDAQPSLTTTLTEAGLDTHRFRRLTRHHDITTLDKLRIAWTKASRTMAPGTDFSMLLTGSPVARRGSGTSCDDFLTYKLRTAWDGREYRDPGHRLRSRRGAPARKAAKVGVLWEMPATDWPYRARTDEASSTRFLIFLRKTPGERRSTPVPVPRPSAACRAVEELVRIYEDLTRRQVPMVITDEAAAKFWPIQLSADQFDDLGPAANQFARLDAHTHRIAAALALAEDTDVVTGGHIEAAWSVVARSALDRSRLLCPDALEPVSVALDKIGGEVRAAAGSPRVLTLDELSWRGGHRTVHTPTAVPEHAVRDRKGRITRDGAVAQDVKDWHRNQCQMCGDILRIPGPQEAISEGAHIRPLSHGGPDYTGNVLCLCPSCHTRFDHGALYLTDDLHIVETLTGTVRGLLRTEPRHQVGLDCVRWHRARWEQHIPPGKRPAVPDGPAEPPALRAAEPLAHSARLEH
ncbi:MULTISPECIES: HNH endonuclease [Kitasatospora]|uniref:HNH endonuclease n=1 Tax=Kitasatospora TaxID=2063 RepID=UPI000686F833|nr:HNH endonuclease [Kitasatospora setae]